MFCLKYCCKLHNVMVLNQMLDGFFALYNFDSTLQIHPPRVNAFFRTAFYPWMTMVMRPLGESLTRLPAFDDYKPFPQGPDGPFEI